MSKWVFVSLLAAVLEGHLAPSRQTVEDVRWPSRKGYSSSYNDMRNEVENMFGSAPIGSRYVSSSGNPSIGINQDNRLVNPTGSNNNNLALLPRNLEKALLPNNQDIVVVLNSTGVGVAQGVGSAIGVSNSPGSGVAIGGSALTTVSQPGQQAASEAQFGVQQFSQQAHQAEQPIRQVLPSQPTTIPIGQQSTQQPQPQFASQPQTIQASPKYPQLRPIPVVQPARPFQMSSISNGFPSMYRPTPSSNDPSAKGKVVLILDSNGVGVSQGLGSAVGLANSPNTGLGIGGSAVTNLSGSNTGTGGLVVSSTNTDPLIYVDGKVTPMAELIKSPALTDISMTQMQILHLAATSKQFRQGMELGIQLGLRVFK